MILRKIEENNKKNEDKFNRVTKDLKDKIQQEKQRIDKEETKQISELIEYFTKKEQFFAAIEKGYIYAIRKLLKDGVNINSKDKDGKTGLMYANKAEIVQELIQRKANINEKDKN